jgi:hypothetical protein
MVVTKAVALAIIAAGYKGICRTLAYKPNASEATDISRAELEMLVEDVGLEVSLYQRPRAPLWTPDPAEAGPDAAAARAEAMSAGYPDGAHIWEDLEGLRADPTAYATLWSQAIAPYRPALYAGFSAQLTPSQLYELPHDRYGSDVANRQVATRGTCWLQGPQTTIAGLLVDTGHYRPDLLGDLPVVAARG